MSKTINVTTDTIGETKVETNVQPCKKVKLSETMSPVEIRALLDAKKAGK